MPTGTRGLIVCKKRLAEDKVFLKDAIRNDLGSPDGKARNSFPLEFEGRHLAVTWWGGHGIGANDWKEADYVFEFGEHYIPS
jgi:hypothetical protein